VSNTQAVSFNLRYPGQQYDSETALYYNHNRYYDPYLTVGYTEADPLGLSAGWNRFGYVNQNPLGAVDPRGLAVDWSGKISSAGATLGLGGQISLFELTSECKCGKKYKISGFASFVTIGAGANIQIKGLLKDASGSTSGTTLTDNLADFPEPYAANGSAWVSGINSALPIGGANFLTATQLGRLKTYSFADGPTFGFDIGVQSTAWGQSAFLKVEEIPCSSCDK